MKIIKKIIPAALLLTGIWFLFATCEKEEEPEIVLPGDYFPVYPGSYWVYSNGKTIKCEANYQLHSYYDNYDNVQSKEKKVPVWDGRYVYKYKIYQNNVDAPFKEILRESGSTWSIHNFDYCPDCNVMREVISLNTTVDLNIAPYLEDFVCDTIFEETDTIVDCDSLISYDSVIVVKEYIDMEGLGEDCWHLKEYYAKHHGLIKREIQDCTDTTISSPVTEFILLRDSITYIDY